MKTEGPYILDVGDADFEAQVLVRSESVPVVVDFWAEWCGPCRALSPALESLAQQYAGAFVLAKVDVDAAPQTAAAHGVRSIPTVLGIRDRTIRAEFVGAQPEPALRQFIESLLPTEADGLAVEAAQLAAAGDAAAAEERFRAALAKEARHGRALIGLARLRAAAGDVDEGLDLLAHVLPHETVADEAERLAAELRVAREGDADPEALRAQVEAAPEDPAARLSLGRALAASGRHAEALEALVEAVRRDPDYEDGAARRAMLDLFEVLGGEHELTQRFRSELARALFR